MKLMQAKIIIIIIIIVLVVGVVNFANKILKNKEEAKNHYVSWQRGARENFRNVDTQTSRY
jgi:hypothetical protein